MRRVIFFLSMMLLSARAFVVPQGGVFHSQTRYSQCRPQQQYPSTVRSLRGSNTWRCCSATAAVWGVRRRCVRALSMSAVSPEDGESDEGAEDAGAGKQGGADAGAGEDYSGDISEATPFYGGGDNLDEEGGNAPLKLLARGDTLPLSYRSDNGTRESEFYVGEDDRENVNPYYDVVRRLSPSELIGRFMRTASPRVQEAVRTTVLGLLGSLPRHAFETTAIATGDALANLMFQLQMTGYMFKNAEYRLSLQSSMRAPAALPPGKDGLGDGKGEDAPPRMEMDDDGNMKVQKPQISGKIKLTYNADKDNERAMEVDADAYMAELRDQVDQLEKKLLAVQNQSQEAVQKDLLVYIKSMPENQLKDLTANVSPEVLESMRLLVETVMGGMGNREILAKTLTQQTGSGMAQLCMWQLVVGFNLREMEAREDMRKNFMK